MFAHGRCEFAADEQTTSAGGASTRLCSGSTSLAVLSVEAAREIAGGVYDETLTFRVFESSDRTLWVWFTGCDVWASEPGPGVPAREAAAESVGNAPSAFRAAWMARCRSSSSFASVSSTLALRDSTRLSRAALVRSALPQCGHAKCGRFSSQRIKPQARHIGVYGDNVCILAVSEKADVES